MKEYLMFIDGEFVDSEEKIESINPATEEVIATFPKAKKEDLEKAVLASEKSFEDGSWRKLSFFERGEILHEVANLIREKVRYLAELETKDVGKPIKQTTFIDIPMAADVFDYLSKIAIELKGETIPAGENILSFTEYEPIGVVGLIIPWNFPFLIGCWKLASALITGNSVIIKPSSLASLTILELGEIFKEVDLPKGVVNIITGYGEEIGKELILHPKIRKISFTGSSETGKEIMNLASSNLKKLTLELGGKTPFIVFKDADLDIALSSALSAIFLNQGEACVAGSRLLIEDKIYDEFIEKLVEKTKKLKIGNGLDPNTDIGPLISASHREKVLNYIKKGIEEGAKLICGGKIPENLKKGYFLEPTIFVDVKNEMSIAQEEIFGPVLSVIKFSDISEVEKFSNDTRYGLSASIWTKDIDKAFYLSRRIKAGTVWINTFGHFLFQAPFGGFKESGFGKELGKEGLIEYMELKHTFLDLSKKPLSAFWF